MFKYVFIASLLVSAYFAAPYTQEEELLMEEQRQQAQNAAYSFESNVDDRINDGEIRRQETRENGKVSGSYGYSDGFVQRTVYYEADENGYRVVKETMENIGDGPQFNENGQADVQTSAGGNYSIKLDVDDMKHYKSVHQ